jgi:hypothetical protein
MWWCRYKWRKIKQLLSPLKQPRYLYWRIYRMFFHWNKELRIVERAKLKCDMGLSWTEKERETMRIVLKRTETE